MPEGDPAAVLQLVHGMAEHIERYDEFARYLAARGVLVAQESVCQQHGRGRLREEAGPGLSKNGENAARYAADPLCRFCFTLNGFHGLLTAFHAAVSQEMAGQVPEDISILFVSGSEDPVGGCGKAVETVYQRYLRKGAQARMKLYMGERHEILNEDDRETVFRDIYEWMVI